MTQNDPVTLLLSEHEVIASANDVVAAMDGLWTRSGETYEQAAREIASFFAAYGDEYHHRKEEVVLFPELRSHPDFYAHDVVDELEDHHRAFRDHLAKLERALAQKDYAGAQGVLRRYLDELLDHIAVENDELFVIAQSVLGETELERVFFRFKDLDRELGDERKVELEGQLAAIRARL